MPPGPNLAGKRFNRWYVVSFSHTKVNNFWNCLCDCGNRGIVATSRLIKGLSKSCGCYRKDSHCENTRRKLEGQKIGMMTVLEFVDSGKHGTRFKCLCDCGTTKIVLGKNLVHRKFPSCGCKKKQIRSKNKFESTIFNDYFARSFRKNIEFNISEERFFNLIKQNCYFCGSTPKNKKKISGKIVFYNGIDRIDSSLGYIENNVVTCCKTCNIAKNTLSLQEFKNWINVVYNHLNSNQSDTH